MSDLRIYLTHNKLILTNDLGYRVEFQIPVPGNTVVINPSQLTFHFGIYADPPRAPSASLSGTDPASSYPPSSPFSAASSEGGGSDNPIEI